jgi:phenylacetate-CoA ligase
LVGAGAGELTNELNAWRRLWQDELRATQLARLKAVLAHVHDAVPHYRQALAEAGVRPGDLKRLEDLSRFPLTSKEDLRRNFPFGFFATPVEKIVRLHVSSGTTGRPTVVGYTHADIGTWSGLMARSLAASGVKPGDKVQIAFGYGLFTGGLGWHYGAERLGATVIPASGGNTERQVQMIRDFGTDIIMATPSYMLVLADELERQELGGGKSRLRLGIFGAEPCGEAVRSELEGRMGIAALDSYGLSEVIGPGVAQELPETKGTLTLWEDHFLPEIIDPESGAVLPDGERGELVLTTLTKEGMPVVRYRTRDLTRLLPPEGNAMRRIERVADRSDDMLIIRGVNVFPSQIAGILQREARLSPHYVIEVRRPHRLDEMAIHVERRAGDGMAEAERRRFEARMAQSVKSLIGVACEVRVVEPEALERSTGKAKRVKDLRPKS